jgi:hypothetical protein
LLLELLTLLLDIDFVSAFLMAYWAVVESFTVPLSLLIPCSMAYKDDVLPISLSLLVPMVSVFLPWLLP